MLPTPGSKASSEVQGEIQWANFHALISLEPTKITNFTSIHTWTYATILNALGADAVSI